MNRQMKRQNECEERDDKSKNPNVAVAPGKNHQQQPACQRHERHQGENDGTESVSVHRTPTQIMNASTTAAPAAIHPAYERMFPDCMCRTSSETRRAPSPASFTAASIMFRSTPCHRIRVEPSISGFTKTAAYNSSM